MTTMNRKLRRNVFFYDVANPGEALGGLCQGGSITNKNFFGMLEIVLVFKVSFTITLEENIVAPSEETLLAGNYYIKSEESVEISNEIWVPRTFSFSLSGRDDDFRNDVRARDGRCVVTGQVNVRPDVSWSGFHAAHVFPLQHETWFKEYDYGRWLPTPPNSRAKISSVQNGLLMASNVHTDFDNYLFSINPDDNYKIVSFMPDPWGIDGKILQDCCRQDSDSSRVSEELFRWHFRQSVLANMRGAGEPIFEHDFPPGYDEIAEVASGLYGKQRLEMALGSRFTIL